MGSHFSPISLRSASGGNEVDAEVRFRFRRGELR